MIRYQCTRRWAVLVFVLVYTIATLVAAQEPIMVEGMQTLESALYNAAADGNLVSNIYPGQLNS